MDDLIRSAELQLKLLNDDRVNAYVTYHDLRAVPRYSFDFIFSRKIIVYIYIYIQEL